MGVSLQIHLVSLEKSKSTIQNPLDLEAECLLVYLVYLIK